MPRSAIETGAVDLGCRRRNYPRRSLAFFRSATNAFGATGRRTDWLAAIIELLRMKTAHDFRLYKPGTLQPPDRTAHGAGRPHATNYLKMLRDDPKELDLLAKDLLINVTCFFPRPQSVRLSGEKILPGLVRDHPAEQPLRVWIAGCSTGEETYSLAMLFREAIAASGKAIKLQVFASDIDGDAVAQAREGLYPASIDAEVSPERLARFFVKEERGYRVAPDLRDMWFSRCRTCWPTRPFPGWTSCPAAIC